MVSVPAAGPATGRASGKVILLGEHAVVHGQPAIAGPLARGLCVTLDGKGDGPAGDPRLCEALRAAAHDFPTGLAPSLAVGVTGDLPEAVGLGSSAALSVALVRALAVASDIRLDAQELARRANRVEALFHGRPSGLDVAAAASSGWIRFRIGEPAEIRPLVCAQTFDLVAIETGATHRTMETVLDVSRRHAEAPEALAPIFRSIGGLVEEGCIALERGDLAELGRIMNANHERLVELGVSTPQLDQAVQAAREVGALGAKLTGGGGGGLAIALVAPDELAATVTALAARGWQSYGLTMAMSPLCMTAPSAGSLS